MKSSMLAPETPLADLNWIPRNRLTPLARLGLSTLSDLIEHYPRRYEDRRRFDRFPDEEMERPVCLFGVATKTSLRRLGGWRRMFEITCENESGGILSQPLTCRWFNMPYIQKMIAVGQRLIIFGRPKKRGRQIVIDHPEFETVEDDEETSIHMNRIAPVHPAGDGVSPRLLRTLIFQALDQADLEAFPNLLPASKAHALRNIHFPATFQQLEVARRHLVREEFFAIQLLIHARRTDWRRLSGTSKDANGRLFDRLLQALPYSLTDSQVEVISDIRRDLAAPRRMNRLLQGDVGSGKTLVALAAMLLTVETGWQAALMAPTQILAEQHYLNFKRLLEPLGIQVALRTASRSEDTAPLPLFASALAKDRGAHASPRAISGVPPESPARRDAEQHTRDAYAPQEIRYSKRNLPHFERPWAKYVITFATRERVTLTPERRDIVLRAILHQRMRFELYAACVMPDHVHLLIEPAIKDQDPDGAAVFFSLTEILHALKSFTAHEINKMEGTKGQVWEKESFDRLIRSEQDLREKFQYITRNPWEAGIVDANEHYPWVWFPECKRGDWGAHRGTALSATHCRASPRAISGVPPETHVRWDRDAYAPQIIVGTHALLYESSEFEDLGLVVIDEQHKFGVLQRARLIARGDAPDVLVMTATPIPRTLTQTLYGDLEVSTLREKPANRGAVLTAVRERGKLPEVVDFVRKQLDRGRQAYIVYPLVEESNKLAAKSATAEFEKWKSLLAPHSIGLLHGRMPPEEKEQTVAKFHAGQLAALITTTVIEVGVDVPNANIMVVENAERFGLAQLHQLRGRIGRGEHKSYCILLHDPKIEETSREKLAVLEKTADGFEIAETDFRLRGPGDLLGTAQTGLPPLKLGDLSRDAEVMRETAALAASVFADDPEMQKPEHLALRAFLAQSKAKIAASAG
jgi:RecG-like helicase/REP element-mobilizing transposase RayT